MRYFIITIQFVKSYDWPKFPQHWLKGKFTGERGNFLGLKIWFLEKKNEESVIEHHVSFFMSHPQVLLVEFLDFLVKFCFFWFRSNHQLW